VQAPSLTSLRRRPPAPPGRDAVDSYLGPGSELGSARLATAAAAAEVEAAEARSAARLREAAAARAAEAARAATADKDARALAEGAREALRSLHRLNARELLRY